MKVGDLKHLELYADKDFEKEFFITKVDIMKNFPKNFMNKKLKEDLADEKLEYTATSGSTSDRMRIMRKKDWWNGEYQKVYEQNDYLKEYLENSEHNKMILTTAICSSDVCYLKDTSMEERIKGRTLYLNSTFNPWKWNKEAINKMVDEWNKHKPFYLDADPIYLFIFIYLKEKFEIKKALHTPKVITLSYEFCPKNIELYLKKKFDSKILNLYGTTEFGYLYLGESGSLNTLNGNISVKYEPFNIDKNIYELIITSYKNEYMPLYSYKVGDLVEKDGKNVKRIMGRKKDSIKIDDGRFITLGEIDDVIAEQSEKIFLYKLIVKNNEIEFKYGFNIEVNILKKITNKLSLIFGKKVVSSFVKCIEPCNSGKFQIINKEASNDR